VERKGVYGRIAVTLIVPIAALLLARIPLPGIATDMFEKFYEAGGGAYDPAEHGIFTLELRPFLSAALWVEVLALLIPRWRALRLGGYPERNRLWTRVTVLALVMVTMQAFFIVRWLRATSETFLPMVGALVVGERNDLAWIVTQTLTMVAGTFLLYWLARLIDRYGTGNGFAVILVAFLLPPMVRELVASAHRLPGETILAPLCLGAVAVAAVTRLAGGRPLRSSASAAGYDRLPMPASGLQPTVAAPSALMVPVSIAQFGSFVLPAPLKRSFVTMPSEAERTGVPRGARMSMAAWMWPLRLARNESRSAARSMPVTGMARSDDVSERTGTPRRGGCTGRAEALHTSSPMMEMPISATKAVLAWRARSTL